MDAGQKRALASGISSSRTMQQHCQSMPGYKLVMNNQLHESMEHNCAAMLQILAHKASFYFDCSPRQACGYMNTLTWVGATRPTQPSGGVRMTQHMEACMVTQRCANMLLYMHACIDCTATPWNIQTWANYICQRGWSCGCTMYLSCAW